MDETRDPLMPRPVSDSQSEMSEIVLPNDTNPLGALLGGRLMHWIDMAGAMAAHRHSRHYVVTASIDHLDFWTPAHVGDLVILRSSVNRVFTTSMEVGVRVFAENQATGARLESGRGPAGRARAVADYIAGMTDRYAILEHRRLYDPAERT